MEYAKDEIFNIRYNTRLNRLEIKNESWTSKFMKFFKKHMLLNIFLIAFILLSSINFLLIYNFMAILTNI